MSRFKENKSHYPDSSGLPKFLLIRKIRNVITDTTDTLGDATTDTLVAATTDTADTVVASTTDIDTNNGTTTADTTTLALEGFLAKDQNSPNYRNLGLIQKMKNSVCRPTVADLA